MLAIQVFCQIFRNLYVPKRDVIYEIIMMEWILLLNNNTDVRQLQSCCITKLILFLCLVIECGDIEGHRLKEFTQLLRPDEAEVDFFENIRHIQLHRRARAIAKLTEMIKV